MSNVVKLKRDWRSMRVCDGKGQVQPRNLLNAKLYAMHHEALAGHLRFCELSKTITVGAVPWHKGAPRSWQDSDATEMRCWFAQPDSEASLQVGQGDCEAVALLAAQAHKYHPIRDYLRGLKWDGIPRVDTWLMDYTGALDTDITRSIGCRVMIAAVARIMRPGCKFDDVLVLEGAQGVRKSSLLPALFGKDWTRTGTKLFDDPQNTALMVAGTWCIELADFAAFRRVDAETVKSLITTQHDDVKLPYGRHVQRFPRASIFVATINPGDCGYLSDPTGNRRYWPVLVRKCDTDAVERDRDQLWAEAMHRYQAGESWWASDLSLLEAQAAANAHRSEIDPWEESILRSREIMSAEWLTASEVLNGLGVPTDRRTGKDNIRVTTILKRLGYQRINTRRNGIGGNYWRRINQDTEQ